MPPNTQMDGTKMASRSLGPFALLLLSSFRVHGPLAVSSSSSLATLQRREDGEVSGDPMRDTYLPVLELTYLSHIDPYLNSRMVNGICT